MSLIYTIEASTGYVELLCPACWGSVGQFTHEEAGELARANIQPFCFECQPANVDEMPKQIMSNEDHYFLGIGNTVFIAQWTIDNFRICPKDLMLSKISLLTYFDLKTGFGAKYLSKTLAPKQLD